MDAIILMMVLFLNNNQPCEALKPSIQRINGHDYQILSYACGDKFFDIWEQKCPDLDAWTPPFKLVEAGTGRGFYTNRFGEVQGAFVQVMEEDIHVHLCGS